MHRALEVIGSQVMDVHSGDMVGRIEDVLFDGDGHLQGVLLEKKFWFGKQHYVPLSQIESIGEDIVTVTGVSQFDEETISDEFHFLKRKNQLLGLPVVTSSGKQLGTVEDVYFQQEMGNIVGYELSDGLIADLTQGRKLLKPDETLQVGKDACVVKPEIEERFDQL